MERTKIYIIYHNNFEQFEYFKKFRENIANNYISKTVNPNLTLIVSPVDGIAFNVFTLLTKGIETDNLFDLGIFIMALDDFYGTLDKEVWQWLEEKTNEKLTED